MPKREEPVGTGAEASSKTPKVLKPGAGDGGEEFSPGTRADFEVFLRERKARSVMDDATRLDKTHPSVIHQSISSSAWVPNTPTLDYSARTWLEWDRSLRTSIGMYGFLALHLDKMYSPPNHLSEPVASRNWWMNDRAVCSFMRSKMSAIELDFVKSPSITASGMYDLLKTRHEQRGPTSQLTMISDALSIDFKRNVPLDQTVQQIRSTNEAIWAMGAPSPDLFLSLLLVRALRKNYPVLYRDIDNSIAAATKQFPFTSNSIINRIAREQADPKEPTSSTSQSSSAEAHVAQTSSRPRPKCPNPKCGREGHTLPYCIREGGGMAGKTVAEARAKQRDDAKVAKESKESANAAPTNAEAHFSALTSLSTSPISSIIDARILPSMTVADISEYEVSLSLDSSPLYASIDWRHDVKADVAFDATIAAPVQSSKKYSPVDSDHPYLSDSCASIHISCERSDFISLKPLQTPRTVRGLGGSSVDAVGVGVIKIKVSKGSYLLLEPALFIPTSTVRLVSVALLAKAGFITTFDYPRAEIRNKRAGNSIVATGEIIPSRNVYKLNHLSVAHNISSPSTSDDRAFLSQSARVPTLDTWHRRLGHVNNQSILDMAKKGLADGMHIDLSNHPPVCQCCILGKQRRSSVPKVRQGPKADRPLRKVYIDLCGPHLLTPSKNQYSVDIIDDYSGYPWSFGAKTKDAAYEIVIAWANREQVRTGHKIVYINIDRGELKSQRFDQWCAERGITVTFTAPDTSAQNGRGERVHLTLMNQARAMRISCQLPANLWDEFMFTAAYTRARTASRSTGKTPFELYEGRKPDLSHMREIGCKAFVLQPNNPKVGVRGEEFVLIGYAQNSKAYRCYHRTSRKVVESFHVDFVERKDEEERPLMPGRIMGIDTTLCDSCQAKVKGMPSEGSQGSLLTSDLDPRPTREPSKVDSVDTKESGYQDQTLEPSEVTKNPAGSGQSINPDLGPSEVSKTPGRRTTIETVVDEDNADPEPRPKRVSKPTAKKAVIIEEKTKKDERKAR